MKVSLFHFFFFFFLIASISDAAFSSRSASHAVPVIVPMMEQSFLLDGHSVNSELATSIWNWDRTHRKSTNHIPYSTRDGLRWVDALVKELHDSSNDETTDKYSDLIQEGMVALMHAMTSYDAQGSSETFQDYAKRHISTALWRLVKDSRRSLTTMSMESTIEVYNPLIDERALFMDQDEMDYQDDAFLGDVDDEGEDLMWIRQEQITGPLRDMIPDTSSDFDDGTTQQNVRQDVTGFLTKCLSHQESQIIRMRFGLDNGRMSLAEVGTIFGMSPSRIKQIEDAAMEKLFSASYSSQQTVERYLEDDSDDERYQSEQRY